MVVAHICVQGGSGEREIWDSLLTFRTDEKEALWDRSAPMGASLPALREGSALTPFGAVLKERAVGERAPGWVQFLALSLFILLALSLRASFTLSPDTCSYDNFCNSISMEEIGFTVHLIFLSFFFFFQRTQLLGLLA